MKTPKTAAGALCNRGLGLCFVLTLDGTVGLLLCTICILTQYEHLRYFYQKAAPLIGSIPCGLSRPHFLLSV